MTKRAQWSINENHYQFRVSMEKRSKYKTRQREMLLDYLRSSQGAHVTAFDVYFHLKSLGSSIGQATVYRHLEALVRDGVVNKYTFDSSSPACFEYIYYDNHEKQGICFHCKCEQCGALIHLNCEELKSIKEHLYSKHQFVLNPLRTVFYGTCEACREKMQESKDYVSENQEDVSHKKGE